MQPRQSIYRRAVRVIDRSPKALDEYLHQPRVRSYESFDKPPLDPSSLLPEITQSRATYPNLRCILHEHPSPTETAYTIHLRGEAIELHLLTRVRFDIDRHSFNQRGQLSLPEAIKCEGMALTQTFDIKLIGGPPKQVQNYYRVVDGHARMSRSSKSHPIVTLWRNWLFSNEKLDQRISSIDVSKTSDCEAFPLNDILNLIRARRLTDCLPIRHFVLPRLTRDPPKVIQSALEVLPTSLSSLSFLHLKISNGPSMEPAPILAQIDQALPFLTSLTLWENAFSTQPKLEFERRPFLPHLRCLKFDWPRGTDLLELAHYLSYCGTRDCFFNFDADTCNRDRVQVFNQVVSKLKR